MRLKGFWKQVNEGVHDMCYIWAKEMKATIQDEGVLIFFIFVPLFYPLLYSWIYNNQTVREVPVAVVDLSHSGKSREFIRDFDASPNTKVAYYCNNLDEAKELIGRQAVHGVLYFPADFSTRLNRMEQSTVSVYADMSMMLNYKAVYQTATAVSSALNADIQIQLSGNMTAREDEITTAPLTFEEVPIFNPAGGYGDFILPGVLMLILHQTLLLGIGLSAGTARENNRYQELVPISRHYNGLFRIVLGKSLCYFMVYAVMSAYVCLCIPRFFGFIQLITMADFIALIIPYLLACIFFGMMLSCLVRYRENVLLLVVFTSVPLLFFSGVSWPESNIPGVWKGIGSLFPSTFGIRAFVRMNAMGATLADVEKEYHALWIQALVYFLVTCGVYRYQILYTRKRAMERLEYMKERAAVAKRQHDHGKDKAGKNS